jgi:hypothetical protein
MSWNDYCTKRADARWLNQVWHTYTFHMRLRSDRYVIGNAIDEAEIGRDKWLRRAIAKQVF